MEQIKTNQTAELIVEEEPTNPNLDHAQVALRGVTKFLIGGMDGAGKSTLTCSIYRALQDMGHNVSLHELDPWSDTHQPILGLKPWEKRVKKSKVWKTTYERTIAPFFEDEASIVLGDMQGRSQYVHNHLLRNSADLGILVNRYPTPKDDILKYPQRPEDWEKLFENLEAPIALRVHTITSGQAPPEDTLWVDNLDRKLVPEHPRVRLLAREIINLVVENNDR